MLLAKIYHMVSIFAFHDRSLINFLIHIKLIFTIYVSTKIFRQIVNLTDFYFEIQRLMYQIVRFFWQLILIKVFIAILSTRHQIQMHPANNQAISSNNRQIFGIIHEICQSFHTINTLAKQNGFRIISKRILKQIHIILILRQSIIYQ